MRVVVPGSFQWDRARTYLAQCEQPFRRDVEPAMHWRILPPLTARYLGLSGYIPLVLPWAGVCALVGYVAVLHARRLPDPQFIFGGTLLVATSSAILVPVGWLGINDAWVWLGLLTVAFGRTWWAVAAACLLCPWIDERFIIGAPLAWVARCLDEDRKFLSSGLFSACWLAPYAVTRLIFGGNPLTNDTSSHFPSTQVQSAMAFLPMAPLGCWMGIRAGWFGIGYARLNMSVARGLLAALVLGDIYRLLCSRVRYQPLGGDCPAFCFTRFVHSCPTRSEARPANPADRRLRQPGDCRGARYSQQDRSDQSAARGDIPPAPLLGSPPPLHCAIPATLSLHLAEKMIFSVFTPGRC